MSSTRLIASLRRRVFLATVWPLFRRIAGFGRIAASVVVPTRDSGSYLELTLAGLERQFLPKSQWDVIIIDDRSRDDTGKILDACDRRGQLTLRVVRSDERRGRAAMLNLGLQAARGDILIFLGDDQLVGPDFVLGHLLAHTGETVVVLGDTHRSLHTHLFAPEDGTVDLHSLQPMLAREEVADEVMSDAVVLRDGTDYSELVEYCAREGIPLAGAWACFSTANASMHRMLVHLIGGADERFGDSWLADRDLGYRLTRAGVSFTQAPTAGSIRQVRPPQRAGETIAGDMLPYFLAKHSTLTRLEKKLLLDTPASHTS